jgi:crotonobetainyl-CoA:carnitine CoA-transferase CaiB-like acyl-CoA transferase
MMNVISILAAYAHKLKTGEGQRLEVNMLSTAISLQCQEAFAHLNMNQKWDRSEAGIGAPWLSAPFGVYPTKDGSMTISMTSVKQLGRIMNLPELETYEDGMDCFTDRDKIKRNIESRTVDKTTSEWLDLLWKHDVWCGPVNSFEEVFQDPQVLYNGLVQHLDHPTAGEMKVIGFPAKFSKTEPSYRLHPPTVGEHNREILNTLGYSDEEIVKLSQNGVTDLPKEIS